MSDEPAPSKIGLAIKLYRTRKGWKRQDLADGSGLSYPYLSEIENGRKTPSMKALEKIAHALGVQASDLQREGEGIADWGPSVDLVEPPAALAELATFAALDVDADEQMIREIAKRVVRELGPVIEHHVELVLRAELRSRGVI